MKPALHPWLFVFFLFSCSVLLAEEQAPTIRQVIINRKNVFHTGTPADNQFPYSWGNKLHIMTQETTIRSDLLFKEGEALDLDILEESERLLRRRTIFRYVKITPQEVVNGQVDVLVETEDVWTTVVYLTYGLAGGEKSYGIGFSEKNFLGLGKNVGVFLRRNIDRTTRGVTYKDPQLFGSRWELFGGYGRDEKGQEWASALRKPFYATYVRHSEGLSFVDRTDEDRHFESGDEVANFDHHSRLVRGFASYALKVSKKKVRRASLAYERNTDEFSNVRGPQAPVLPEVRRVNPVLAGFEYQNVRYYKARSVMTFDRDEDINLGGEWYVEGGPSNEHFGATQRGWVGRASVGKNFRPHTKQLWLNTVQVDGRLEENNVQDGTLRIQTEYFLLNWLPKHTASLRGEHLVSENLDPETEFLLGGENGLRGYSVREFSGDNRTLFTLEDRRVVLYDWLHLVSIGWAVFADMGAVWDNGAFPKSNQLRSDIGGGLRLAPSRSTNPGLIRVDVAYALQDNDRSSRFVLNIGADLTFGDRRKSKFER